METIKFLFMCLGILSFLRFIRAVYKSFTDERLNIDDITFLQEINNDVKKLEPSRETLVILTLLNASIDTRRNLRKFVHKTIPRISETMPMDEDLHQLLVKISQYNI